MELKQYEPALYAIKNIISDQNKEASKISHKITKAYLSISFFDMKCMRIHWGSKAKFLSIPSYLKDTIKPLNFEGFSTQKNGWIRLPIQDIDDVSFLGVLINAVYNYCYEKAAGELIGCCHSYVACSDAKSCIQEDKPWAKGCYYRKNLINGKIFYGKNSILAGR
ncbi:MAG: hypothetical protein KGZ56_00825 [Dethiobacter sp.]|nr:hypothetical protein [Dethiobacter sp.]MBS3898676.1 hypothetical protein [Dethiobacter sp.]